MSNSMHMTDNSCIWEVNTSEGTFKVFFPCGVFTEEDKFMYIPKAVRDCEFVPVPENASEAEQKKINKLNASALQEKLEKAICFGTAISQGRVDLDWGKREIHVM